MQDEQTDPVFEQALEWLLRLEDEEASDAERAGFEAWIAQSPDHATAFERAKTLWGRFDIVRPEVARLRRKQLIRRRAVLGGLAALIAAPTIFAVTRPGLFADYKSGAGERLQANLPDGSFVELGSQTAMSVDFTPEIRRLVLHGGQAFFRVAPDPGRPFVVEAGDGTATALGTAFDMKFVSDRVTVAVIEHAVEVRADGRGAIVVEEGWEISYGDGAPQPLRRSNPAVVEAWRDDRLVFEDVPLREVLAELERYRGGSIILTNGRLGDMPVTAIFDATRPENALDRIAETLPIRIFDAGGFVTLVSAR